MPGPVAGTHWARWHRGPIVASLVDPEPPDWPVVAELGVPAVLVHSKPLDPPELAEALACGASALVAADRVDAHFLSVLRMVSPGYLVVDSMPMRPLIGAVRARWDERAPGGLELPELNAPLVIKPRFGSWGDDVIRCDTDEEIDAALSLVYTRPWFTATGAVAQKLVYPRGYDLRIIVAAGQVVGSPVLHAPPVSSIFFTVFLPLIWMLR